MFSTIFYEPLYNLIIVFYRLLGSNLGLSIIAIGILSRFVMIPLTLKQIKMAEKNKEFSAKVKEVKQKYKNDKQKQQQEMMKLQQEYLPGQLAGCLPLILQFIVFIYIYQIIRGLIDKGVQGFNDVAYSFVAKFPEDYSVNTSFLGLDLKKSASQAEGSDLIAYLALVLLVGVTQYFSTKILMAIKDKKKDKSENLNKKKKKDTKSPDDFGEIMQQSTKQAMMLMPILLMFISYNLPSGLSIYLITTSAFVILQQLFIEKFVKKESTDIQTDSKSKAKNQNNPK
jgi:YidC/Oxa1 family membrane protein insertase